ncbi:hypothetical protein TTHERM_01082990 (macronuclear) [Tetrahymena thermophila SB210]|uniref:Uncharacterized protein n=1 Tax=Tetrahymena thermophila (strain SB210) TaxID=312017 RepID=Q22BW9_TETTS|nr:hypothetical protein TTHERM_01082990 [Tetrahymena thermophila SB210]EAR82789.1 hypothetical protein TTHERM_01082990 [Tetrahymena thermophila SB210]|eukprot:XP_001030452.1 hypothetical protein TTHERM_01082990 [Tetrahymena thermophila SB210]
MGNLFRIIQHEETPLMMPDSSFDNLINADMQHTLESIKKIKNESQPVCMTHKRFVDQICLYERCRESERFMCPICKIRSHQNHEEHFVSIYDFKNDLLQYINERRQERITLLNSFKRSQATIKCNRLNQSNESNASSEQNVLINRATTSSFSSSSSNQNELYDSLVKQLQKTEKLSEQFILEGLVNDIDSLINKIRKLNKTQYESKKASNELIQFNQTFQNIFKNFIQKKNLSEAKIFWSQHDLINEINCGLNDNNYEMSSQAASAQHHEQSNRSLLSRQVLSKKNSRGLQTSASSYSGDKCNQNQVNTQIKRKQKQQQPFMSLIKFFESFEHRIIDKLSNQKISHIYPIIYLSQNYCLIIYSTGFSLNTIGLYDLVNSKLVKSQRIDLNQSGLQNFYEIGLFQFLDDEFQQQHYFHQHNTEQINFINEPIIQEQMEETETVEQSIIQISDDDNLSNQQSEEEEIQSESQQHRQNRRSQDSQRRQQYYPLAETNEMRNNYSQNQQDRINRSADGEEEEEIQIGRYQFQNQEQMNQKEDNSPSPQHQYSNNYEIDNHYQRNEYSSNEVITINSVSRKTSSEISQDDIAVFSPIEEDTRQQDEYDSELDNLKNMFTCNKDDSLKESFSQKHRDSLEIKNPFEQDNKNDKTLFKQNNKNASQISKSINYLETENNSGWNSNKISKKYESKLNKFEEKQKTVIEESEDESNEESSQNNSQQSYKIKDKNVIVISDSESSNSVQSDEEVNYKRANKTTKQNQSDKLSNRNQKKPLSNIKEDSFEDEVEEIEELIVEDEEQEEQSAQNEQNQNSNNYFNYEEEYNQHLNDHDEFIHEMDYTNDHIYQEPFIELTPTLSLHYQPIFFNTLDSSVELNLKANFNLLVRNQPNRVIQIEKSNLIFKKINFQGYQTNSDILVKEKTIYTKNQIKQVFTISPLIICVCEKKSTLMFLFSSQDSLTFYNTRTKKMIKKINNLEFNNENIKPLRIGKGHSFICFKTFKRNSTHHFVIYNWKTEKEVKRFELKGGATFENMRIFIEFYYQMYQDLDFDSNKVCLQIGDKLLQSTNFQENSLQYCIPYYCQNQERKYYQLGICYLHNKMLKSIPFSIKHISLDQGISQMFISNDQLVIILKNGEIHHCHVKNLPENVQKSNQASPQTKKSNFILIN